MDVKPDQNNSADNFRVAKKGRMSIGVGKKGQKFMFYW
jgi:hypothetical protein